MKRKGRTSYMRKRRSKPEVAAAILQACIEPNIPTRMMYESNTSWNAFRKHLDSLCEKGFIDFRETKIRTHRKKNDRILGLYEITDKGRALLLQLETIQTELAL